MGSWKRLLRRHAVDDATRDMRRDDREERESKDHDRVKVGTSRKGGAPHTHTIAGDGTFACTAPECSAPGEKDGATCPQCSSTRRDRMYWNATKATGCNPSGFDPYHDGKSTAPPPMPIPSARPVATRPESPAAIEAMGDVNDPSKPIVFQCNAPECPGQHDAAAILRKHFADAPPDVKSKLHSIMSQIAKLVEADPMMIRLGVALHERGIEPGDPIMIAFGAQPFARLERGADGAYTVVMLTPLDGKPRRVVLGPVPRHTRDTARRVYQSLDPETQFAALQRMIDAGLIPADFGIDADAGATC